MRVTFGMFSDQVRADIARSSESLIEAQQKSSSGKRIQKPSDDISGVGRSLNLRSMIAEIDQMADNTDNLKTFLSVTSTSLDSVVKGLQDAHTLALSAANSTMTEESRAVVASQINQIMESMAAAGNAKIGGQYIFAGSKTDSPPFTKSSDGTYTYQGNDVQTMVNIAPGTSIARNVTGDSIFNMAGSADPSKPDVFATLSKLRDEIKTGDVEAISKRAADVQANFNNAVSIRSQVGSRLNRLQSISDGLVDSRIMLADHLSEIEDIDLTEAVLDLQTKQNVYQAAIATAGRILDTSLVDYLR